MGDCLILHTENSNEGEKGDFIFRTKSQKKPLRSIIRIFSNGETEINYFNEQKNAIKKRCGLSNNRNIKIIPIYQNQSIKKSLQTIIKQYPERILKDNDKIFCVFDVDNTDDSHLEQALKSKPRYVDLILSNPCFEFWLLLHFRYHNQSMTIDEAATKIKNFLPTYTKPNIQPYFSILKPREETAIKYAKQVRREHQKNGYELNSRIANPHTHMDSVVELLNSV